MANNFAACKSATEEAAVPPATTVKTQEFVYDSSLNRQGISIPMGDGLFPGPSYNLKNLLFLYEKERNNY
jgi:hypothetical protein